MWCARRGRRCRSRRSTRPTSLPSPPPRWPPAYVDAFFRFNSDGEFDDSAVVDTVSRITGRQPRRFEQWARAHARAFH